MGVPNVLIVSMASDLGWSIGEFADPRAANGFLWTVSTLGLGDKSVTVSTILRKMRLTNAEAPYRG